MANRRHGRWRRRSRPLTIGALALAGTATAIALWATGASGSGGFRTATATMGTASQLLGVSGTVDPVNEATAEFQVAGTVSAVDVSLGQIVTAGQTLASLDPSTLQQAVSSAELNLSSDEAKLAEDEAAQSTTTTTTTTTTSAPASGGGGGTLSQDQAAVTMAQHTADADSQSTAAALAQAQSACANPGTGSTTTTTTPTDDSTSCASALADVLTAEEQVSADQKAVAGAENTLAQLLNSSSTSGSESPGAANGSGGSSNDTPQNDSDASDSAQQLATDQAAIDSDEATLIEAKQALADAQLTSPLSGTIASVDLSPGQSVAAGDTSDAITVINTGTYQVTASLTSARSTQVHVGDKAIVSVDGITGSIDGTVSRVGPVDTSDSGDTYPLIVALSAGAHDIAAGAAAQAQVVLRQAQDTLVVPTSAVSTSGTHDSYVLVLQAGEAGRGGGRGGDPHPDHGGHRRGHESGPGRTLRAGSLLEHEFVGRWLWRGEHPGHRWSRWEVWGIEPKPRH